MRFVFAWALRLWDRLVLYLCAQGFKIPGLAAARNRLSGEEQARFDRRLLVREIKGSRLLVQNGPLWLRRAVARPITMVMRYRGIFVMLLKIAIGAFVTVLPVGFFILVRGILPVPGRVPYVEPLFRLPKQASIRTDWPYTGGNSVKVSQPLNLVLPGVFRGAEISWLDATTLPAGLVKIGLGQAPGRVQEFRGFLVAEGAPISLVKQRNYLPEVSGKNRLLMWVWLFPSGDKDVQCRLEVRDDSGRLLLDSESGAPILKRSHSSGILEDLRERLTPASFSVEEKPIELSLDLDNLPAQLSLRSVRVGDSVPVEEELNEKYLSRLTMGERAPSWASFSARDLSESKCVYAVGRIAYERSVVHPLLRRGLVMISVDGLRSSLANDPLLMPNLNRFMNKNGLTFQSHFSNSNTAELSLPSIWHSVPARSLTPTVFAEGDKWENDGSAFSLVQSLQNAGYRSVAIGRMSNDDTSQWEETVSVENRHYETRSITEEAGKWLERNGESPFFMNLHYATFRSPFRPPFEDLSLADFLHAPLGYSADAALERGLAKFFDKEFSRIIGKLEFLGILADVDIAFVGVHGTQMSLVNYGPIVQTLWPGKAAVRSRSLLMRDELLVPFFVVKAGQSNKKLKINEVTTNMDIAPTMARLMGSAVSPLWQGRDLSPIFSGNYGLNLSPLKWIVADGINATGVFSPLDGRKYVKQFAADSLVLFRKEFPWRETVSLDEGEYFARSDAANVERWTRSLESEEARLLRGALWKNVAAQRVLVLDFMDSGKLEYTMHADVNAPDDVRVEQIPRGISVRREVLPQGIAYTFYGLVKGGDRLEIGWRQTKWKNVEWSDPFVVVGCSEGKTFSKLALVEELRDPICMIGELPPMVAGESLFRTRARLDFVERKNGVGIKAFVQEKSGRGF